MKMGLLHVTISSPTSYSLYPFDVRITSGPYEFQGPKYIILVYLPQTKVNPVHGSSLPRYLSYFRPHEEESRTYLGYVLCSGWLACTYLTPPCASWSSGARPT